MCAQVLRCGLCSLHVCVCTFVNVHAVFGVSISYTSLAAQFGGEKKTLGKVTQSRQIKWI